LLGPVFSVTKNDIKGKARLCLSNLLRSYKNGSNKENGIQRSYITLSYVSRL
jgi:hypothetical protein